MLGPYKGRASAIGATAAHNFKMGPATPATLRFRLFREFGVKRRLEGTAAFLSLTVPLKMKLPAAAGE